MNALFEPASPYQFRTCEAVTLITLCDSDHTAGGAVAGAPTRPMA
jgi:hypothetical protein